MKSTTPHPYELLDFGDGRKLERFAGLILNRPSPAAVSSKRLPDSDWKTANFSFQEGSPNGWTPGPSPENWLFRWHSIVIELKLSPFGHVGLFPEQISNWRWLEALVQSHKRELPPKLLNLFGYTGGSTLAMAAAGCHVSHVDASRPTVQWARKNGLRSQLEHAPIRWIVDDVRAFANRERKRSERYDVILMDPPAYGHGVDGQSWILEAHLDELVETCLKLLNPNPIGFLLTGHSPIPSIEQGPLRKTTRNALEKCFDRLSQHRVALFDLDHRPLDLGYAYRYWNEG